MLKRQRKLTGWRKWAASSSRAICSQGRFPQKTSLAFGVVATPQVFLFDGQRKLRYVGRIDDAEIKTVTSHGPRREK